MIPDYESLMAPVLRTAASRTECHVSELRDTLAQELRLSPEELQELLPSGRMTTFASRVHWAKTYLQKAGALESPARGRIRITARGHQLQREHPERVDNAILDSFEEFRVWKARSRTPDATSPRRSDSHVDLSDASLSPREALDQSYRTLREDVLDELLERVSTMSPTAFEHLVLRLMTALGYGGIYGEATHLGGRDDGGVDGLIRQDKLGLERIYLQAKRWSRPVGRPDVQAFVGSLAGVHADKGVMLSTSEFSEDARRYVTQIGSRIVLIDGRELVGLMYEAGLGASTVETLHLKAVDTDFFEPEIE
jgi:restriction system protein